MFAAYDLCVLVQEFTLQSLAIFIIKLKLVERLGANFGFLFQKACNRRQELVKVYWLFDKADDTQIEGKRFIFGCYIRCGKKYDWNIARLGIEPQLMDKTKPIHFGHENIRDDQRGTLPGNCFERLIAFPRREHA